MKSYEVSYSYPSGGALFINREAEPTANDHSQILPPPPQVHLLQEAALLLQRAARLGQLPLEVRGNTLGLREMRDEVTPRQGRKVLPQVRGNALGLREGYIAGTGLRIGKDILYLPPTCPPEN